MIFHHSKSFKLNKIYIYIRVLWDLQKAANGQFHHLETQRSIIRTKLKNIVTLLFISSFFADSFDEASRGICLPPVELLSFTFRAISPSYSQQKCQLTVLGPQLREGKRISTTEEENVLRRTFLARSLSFASFGKLFVIDFLQSELTRPRRGLRFPTGD